MPRPRAYPSVYEASWPVGAAEGRERLGWEIPLVKCVLQHARKDYPLCCASVGVAYTRAQPPLVFFLAEPAAEVLLEETFDQWTFKINCRGQLSKCNIDSGRKVRQQRTLGPVVGWCSTAVPRTTNYYFFSKREGLVVVGRVRSFGMTIAVSEKAARRAEMRRRTRERERKNRVGTNMKPHIHEIIEEMADETMVGKQAMVRILLLEALKARGVDLDKSLREWKARQGVQQES